MDPLVALVVILALGVGGLLVYLLHREMAAADGRTREALEAATAQLAVEGLQAAPERPREAPRPMTVEEIHRRYEGMKDADPKRAALRMYEEQLEIHGRG